MTDSTPTEVKITGYCPFLTCLVAEPHAHPVCPDCGAVRYGNAFCDTCKELRGDDLNPHRLLHGNVDDALAEIRKRSEAATPGPWWSDDSDQCWRLHGVHARVPSGISWLQDQVVNHQILKAPKTGTQYAEYWPSDADAAFIVSARTDVPRLLAAVTAVLTMAREWGTGSEILMPGIAIRAAVASALLREDDTDG